MNLNNIKTSIKTLEDSVGSLKGKVNILEEQYQESTDKLTELKELELLNTKSVELLNHVQKATKELIKSIFEKITTHALQYIHQSDAYTFELEFGKRGNLPEMNFCIKTPEMQEAHDIIETRGGGSCDIISLALRLVLLEVSKNEGFLFVDEPSKHLDNPETIEKMIDFIKETQKDTGRQIFVITHKQEIVDSVDNPIMIESKKEEKRVIEDKPKKKRGRPKKEKK